MADFFAAGLGPSPEGAHNPLAWASLFAQAAPAAETWSVPEAFFCVLFRAASCDGDVDRLEHEELLALAHRSRALRSLSVEGLSAVNAAAAARLAVDSETALREACAALPADMRASAFAHALDLVLCDGELVVPEAAFLNDLIVALELEADEVKRITNVIVLKNLY